MRFNKGNSIRDFIYSSASRYFSLILNVIGSGILARMLNPEDFGKVAILLIIQSFFFLFGEMGIGIGVIQNINLKLKDYKGIYTFTLLVATSLSLIFILLSYLIFSDKDDFNLGVILSINIFFFIVNIVPLSLNKKFLFFKKISILEFISLTVSWIICIIMAYHDFSFYSIAFRYLILSLVFSIFCFFNVKNHIGIIFNLQGVKKIFGFSLYQMLFNSVNFISSNLDQMIIKFFYNNNILGIYNRSYMIMTMPIGNITGTLSSVLLSYSNQYSNDKDFFFKKYFDLLKILILISFAVGIFFYSYSDNIILLIYGQKWVEAIPVFKSMSALACLQIILSFSGVGFQVLGESKRMFKSGAFLSIIVLILLFFNSFFLSFDTIVYFLTLAYLIGGVKIYSTLFKDCFNKSPFLLLKFIIKPLICFLIILSFFFYINIFRFDFITKSIIIIMSFIIVYLMPNIKEIIKLYKSVLIR